jgi:hypothetical protein
MTRESVLSSSCDQAHLVRATVGCNVVHEDVAFCPGVDPHDAKMELKHQVERMGGKLPAEHG